MKINNISKKLKDKLEEFVKIKNLLFKLKEPFYKDLENSIELLEDLSECSINLLFIFKEFKEQKNLYQKFEIEKINKHIKIVN